MHCRIEGRGLSATEFGGSNLYEPKVQNPRTPEPLNFGEYGCHMLPKTLLGGSCDLVTIYNWGCNRTYKGGSPYKAIERGFK